MKVTTTSEAFTEEVPRPVQTAPRSNGKVRLDEQQLTAVTCDDSVPTLVLAGAGSGKTTVLVHRLAYLIDSGVTPEGIICCTFSRKAADELKERLVALDRRTERANVNTIHGICLGILREENVAREVIAGYEQKRILGDILKKLDWDVGWRYPLRWIDLAKSRMYDDIGSHSFFSEELSKLVEQKDATLMAEKLTHCYAMYEREKQNMGRIDFVDMLFLAWGLLQQQEILKKWQARVSHVLIDEMQDTDGLQISILASLAAPQDRIFCVGDPDQSIYKWRSATPDVSIYGFRKVFRDGQVLRMETNYRSTAAIVDVANCVLEGVLIATPNGTVPIEDIGLGDVVLAAQGRGTVGSFNVLATKRVEGWRNIVSVYVDSHDNPIELTSEHRVFVTAKGLLGKTLDTDGRSWVYLMRKKGNYRIGVTKSPSRRLTKEQGDGLWLIHSYDSASEARLDEAVIASRYGLPQVIFNSDARGKNMSQADIDVLFATVDTGTAAQRLAFDVGLDLDEPLFVDDRKRVLGKLCEIEPGYQGRVRPRHHVVLNTTDASLRGTAEALGFRWNRTSQGNYRAQKYGDDWTSLRAMGQRLANVFGYDFREMGCWVKLPYRGTQPEHELSITCAGNLVPGLDVALLGEAEIILGRVTKVEHRRGPCVAYDLEIDQVHNFIAGGMVVHNCAIAASYENDDDRRAFRKTLLPRPDAPAGDPPVVSGFLSTDEEAQFVGDGIAELIANGNRPGDVFVLYRTNAQSRPIEDQLISKSIPYVIAGGDGFYSRAVVKDVLAYMTVVENPDESEALKRIGNIASADFRTHYRGFGAAFYAECERSDRDSLYRGMKKAYAFQPAFKQRGIDDLMGLLSRVKVRGAGSPTETIIAIRELCYDSFLRRKEGLTADEELDSDESGASDLDELVEAAIRFKSIGSMLAYVRMVQRMQAMQQKGNSNCVVLSTIHRCVAPDTLVETARGLLPIKDVARDGLVGTAYGAFRYGNKVSYERRRMLTIRTRRGYEISVTDDHGLFTWDGNEYVKKTASELIVEDFLRLKLGSVVEPSSPAALPPLPDGDVRAIVHNVPGQVTEDFAEFLGMMVADGTVFHGGFRLAKGRKEILGRFTDLVWGLFSKEAQEDWRNGTWGIVEVDSVLLSRWLLSLGGLSPNNKAVPMCILRSPSSVQAAFLRGLFIDAAINIKGDRLDHIALTTVFEPISRVVQTMLLRLGMISSRYLVEKEGRFRSWRVALYGQDARHFVEEIGFLMASESVLAAVSYGPATQQNSLPVRRHDERLPAGTSARNNGNYRGYVSRLTAESHGGFEGELGFYHDRIASIEEYEGPAMCIEVPAVGRFLQNGFDGANSKGLERPVVFGIGIADGLLPHIRALGYTAPDELPFVSLSDVKDERCGMFVLVSRAKERLFLSWPESYRGKAMAPSRFLQEIGLVEPEEQPVETQPAEVVMVQQEGKSAFTIAGPSGPVQKKLQIVDEDYVAPKGMAW